MHSNLQKIGRIIWLGMLFLVIILYCIYPDSFSAHGIHEFIIKYNKQAIGLYILISLIRGIFLIPSTPFVLCGILLFPNQLWLVFIISMIGILFGSSILYFFSDRLGFGELIQSKKPKLFATVQNKMTKYGMPIVIGWSFFPAVPTDVICCVAGLIKMNYLSFIVALAIGETVLVAGYLYTGQAIVHWFLGY